MDATSDMFARYTIWKSHIPYLYDFFLNHNLEWPSGASRWGAHLYSSDTILKQQIFFSNRTDGEFNQTTKTWQGYPALLLLAEAEVPLARVTVDRKLGQFSEQSKSPHVNIVKRIVHPGDVNCIRVWSHNPNIVATHSDSPLVYMWNTETQPNRQSRSGADVSEPELTLAGHDGVADYALDFARTGPFIASGGRDKKVLVWGLQDYQSHLNMQEAPSNKRRLLDRCLQPRFVFQGHTATVEDVRFHPEDERVLCSVGDDRAIIIWDVRQATAAVKMPKMHSHDINCVDWCVANSNQLATGSSDKSIKIVDIRKTSVLQTLKGHGGGVTTVQWAPSSDRYLASSGEDTYINIWDLQGSGGSQVIFQHAGHRTPIVDFQWNPKNPWLFTSTSDDSVHAELGGGTLQIWRPTDLIYRQEEEVLIELTNHLKAAEKEAAAAHATAGAEPVTSVPMADKNSEDDNNSSTVHRNGVAPMNIS